MPGYVDGFVIPVPRKNLVIKKVLQDPRMENPPDPMPFDPKRMVYGGFKLIVER